MVKKSPALQACRARIDELDSRIVELLCDRFEIIREVAVIKKQEGIPTIIEERIREVIDRAGENAGPENEDMVREVYMILIAVCCDLEEQIVEDRPPLRDSEDVRGEDDAD